MRRGESARYGHDRVGRWRGEGRDGRERDG